jgi:hypothetical protein
VALMSKARHRGTIICLMFVGGELTTHGASYGEVESKEAGVVDAQHEFLFIRL